MFPADNDSLKFYQTKFFEAWPRVAKTVYDVDARRFSLFPTEFDSVNIGLEDWSLHFRRTWWLPITTAVLYCVAVHLGQRFMADKKPMGLKWPLALWNLFLAVFSFIGAVKVVPYFLYTLGANGPVYFLCRNSQQSYAQSGEVSFWCLAFVLSKYAELIDTVFLVVRKKPVPFLHWYHHASVLIISIFTMGIDGPTGIVMVAMNLVVHAVMYFYYFLAAVLSKPPKWGQLVTILQIVQMVIGCALAGGMYWVSGRVEGCYSVPLNNAMVAVIYGSYLVLFMRFYIARYNKRPDARKPKKLE